MVKRGSSRRGQIASDNVESPQANFQAQLNGLLKQQKYRQALDEIQKARRSQPDLTFSPAEGNIWLLRGKQEFQKGDFRQAERSLERSLELGVSGESHYWLAKCLLAMNRLDAAIDLLRPAFDEGTLPKDYSICYAKLLLLKGDVTTVEQLLTKKKARFPAAQQHWLRGVLALQANQPDTALACFQKVKNPPTPGDRLDIWLVYIQQALENWDAAALKLGLGIQTTSMWGFAMNPVYKQHPLLQRLALMQHLKTGHPPLETMEFKLNQGITEEIVNVLSVVEFLEENNPHDAAHTFLNMDRQACNRFPELATLRPVLLTLAGQQAMTQGELSCAATFWKPLITEQPFNPQLTVNLLEVLRAVDNHREEQQLLTQLLRWLEQQPKKHPENWPEEKHHRILAHAHCRLADNWMAMGRKKMAQAEVQKAERIYPRSPEVIGRQGLSAALDGKHETATQLLTQALEEGCSYAQVYTQLVDSWKHLGKSDTALQVRRRFGNQFGDLNPEAEVVIPPWIDALSTGDYGFFNRIAKDSSKTPDPPLRACQIFVEAVQSEPNSGGRVSLDQAKALKQWDSLLQPLSSQDQVATLQAIAISILLFAKREKGIAALSNQYILKLYDLGATEPEAREAHLLVLSLKERDSKKLQTPLRAYLDSVPQPGNALAQIQLKRRRFTQDPLQYPILRSFIDDALRREPQNPLLLLAKATTYLPNSPTYEEFKQQGFEIARRLQDARALQAFREEQSYLEFKATQDFLPDPTQLDNLSESDLDNILEQMIRKMFGNQIPPSELKRMLPELKRMAMEEMPDFDDDDDDDDDFFGFGFGGFSPGPARKKRRGFGKR
jgi:tetratricopeptide (TPR) repeat protein